MKEQVILVDENDAPIGICEKIAAHQNGGQLHRAISIFVFSSKGEMLLQQRAKKKYHCGGLWTNTCCSHPRPGESTEDAAHRRLKEEMGFDCPLSEIYSFTYRTEFTNGLTEHEYDHVLVGVWDGIPEMNREEADGWKYAAPESILGDMRVHPEQYTSWFKISFADVLLQVRPVDNSR
ncbi:MAG: isopentenyl-diphosphate Delta-isomerase [Candidatus Paceibacterota bacterium]|jgi:isopentenyl-diphosphate delta-isomerase|nr:isopentenyl-diphosphate Delta-isomerase [Candidatus Paceibacterota bacterium]